MIFLAFTLFLALEVFVHWYFIKVLEIDPTPDRKFSWLTVGLLAFRGVLFYLPWLFSEHNPALFRHELINYVLGAGFLHLTVFGPALNYATDKPLLHLGKGVVDTIIMAVTKNHPIGRFMVLGIPAFGFIYGYFHPELY
jgi:hypothetical protein